MTRVAIARSPRRGRRVAGWLTVLALMLTPVAGLGADAAAVAGPAGTASVTGSQAAQLRPGNPKAFQFIATVNGRPVHWNKCRRIGFRVHTRGAPVRAIRQAKEAVHRLDATSGLHFVYRGRSKAQANPSGKGYPRDTDLVIGWSTPKQSIVPRGAAGIGGPRWLSTGQIVTGFVLLNRNVKLTPGFGTGPRNGIQGTIGQVLMHELGHAVGLDHVKDSRQIMYPISTHKLAIYGAGDANGLRRVGSLRACF
ncbi:MAG: matrixin family metalloprotease [Nocardioidaceae bacterium]